MMPFFRKLGDAIAAEWFRAEHREDAFPAICVEALLAKPPVEHLSAAEVVSWGLSTPRLPYQHDPSARFGEPPITVYAGDRFHIDVNFWLTATTAIHNHGFNGAFQVLLGGSIHTLFDFAVTRVVSEQMELGTLSERVVERLEPGDTREIRAGATIHSLFHLDHPSATVVVRTPAALTTPLQLNYYRPSLAVHPNYDAMDVRRRCQLLTFLAKTDRRRVEAACMRYLGVGDFVARFLVLHHCIGVLSPEEGDMLLDGAEARDAEVGALVRAVVTSGRREGFLAGHRASVTDASLRFFLAVLLNVRGRENALRLVREKFPRRDPVDTILGWIRTLDALPGPSPDDPSALGFRLDDTVTAVLEAMLRGADDKSVLAHIAKLAQRSLKKNERAHLLELCASLRQSEIFGYLLQ